MRSQVCAGRIGGNTQFMSERMSNEHGHNTDEKAEDETRIPADPTPRRSRIDGPEPKKIPANEGGQDEPADR